MGSIPNPPIFDEATPPVANQTLVYDGTKWVPGTITSAAITVPGAALADTDAPAAVTAVTVATANAAVQSGGYVQADVQTIATLANALKVELNKAIADLTLMRTELATLTTAHNALISRMETAAILTTV